MKINTSQFGELEINEDDIINFQYGIPGFKGLTRYALLNQEDDEVFSYLQSVDNPEVSFILMHVTAVIPDYSPIVDKGYIEDLGAFKDEDLLMYNIANIPDNIKEMTVNLRAPIIINPLTGKGKQVVANNEEYAVKHKLFDNSSEAGDN